MTCEDIRQPIDKMTLDEKIGQMFMANICGGESLDVARRNFEDFHFGGLQFSGVFERFVRGGHYRPCGVCRNEPLEDVARFLADVKKAAVEITGVPVIMGGDQEGGVSSSIFRRRNVSLMPLQMGLGAAGSPEDAYLAARVSALEAKTIGLDMLYGPSLDVNTNPKNPEIGARSFGEDAEAVAALGEQVIRAYADVNVISCAKHFPGRGHGMANAHDELETIELDRARLDAVELVPFRRAIAAGVDAIMVGHSLFPAIEPERLPASLSERVIRGLLREELGFRGVIIPDTLTMFAISKNFDVPRACAMCLEAGADMIFMKVQALYEPVTKAIMDSVRAGRLTEERINASVERILTLKAKRALFHPAPFSREALAEVVGCPEHVEAARKLARKSLLVLKNDRGLLPIPGRVSLLTVVPRDMNVILANDSNISHDMLPRYLKKHFENVETVLVDEQPTEIQGFEAVARAKNADVIVFGVYSAGASGRQLELLQNLLALDRPLVVAITGSPYLADRLPDDVRAIVCTFGATPPAFEAFADLLAGKLSPTAVLPVTVSARMCRGFSVPVGK